MEEVNHMLTQNSDKQQISINIRNQQVKYNNREVKKKSLLLPVLPIQ